MADDCSRLAFQAHDGCPAIDADLSFPDFESCEDLDTGRLKGAARLSLQKSPAFPVSLQSFGQLPIPDIDADDVCPLDELVTESAVDIVKTSLDEEPSGTLSISKDSSRCLLYGINLSLKIPTERGIGFDVVANGDGSLALQFSGLSGTAFL